MDVGTAALRAELKHYLDRVRDGEEIVITDRDVPVARIVPIASGPTIDELTRRGVISPASRSPRRRAASIGRVRATGPVADLVADQRR